MDRPDDDSSEGGDDTRDSAACRLQTIDETSHAQAMARQSPASAAGWGKGDSQTHLSCKTAAVASCGGSSSQPISITRSAASCGSGPEATPGGADGCGATSPSGLPSSSRRFSHSPAESYDRLHFAAIIMPSVITSGLYKPVSSPFLHRCRAVMESEMHPPASCMSPSPACIQSSSLQG